MNKKQAAIILTLIVLIACVGVLSTKVNSPLTVNDDMQSDTSNKSTVSLNNDNTSKATVSSQSITEMRLTKEQSDKTTIETLKNMIDDKNTSKENKDIATKKSISISTAAGKASKIESQLKSKGFADAVCYVEEDNVKVVVKADTDKLTEQQQREIKEVVISTTQLKNIKIEVKH